MTPPILISSRDNPLLKSIRKLQTDAGAYRKQGKIWLEGEHLCLAAIAKGKVPEIALFSHSYWPHAPHAFTNAAVKNGVLDDALFSSMSGLESPASMGFVMGIPPQELPLADAPTVILDRVQDPGNVGSILRTAAAFGFKQIIALEGTAGIWSPKVVRAGMGAHFALHIVENQKHQVLANLAIPLVVTSSHQGEYLQNTQVPMPCAWIMGHEGQGVCAELLAQATHRVRIGQPGGEESLNVAAAAAICLHASSLTQRD